MSTSKTNLRSTRSTPGKSKQITPAPRRNSVGHFDDSSNSYEDGSSSENSLIDNRKQKRSPNKTNQRGRGAARGRGATRGRGTARGRGRGGKGAANSNSDSASNDEQDEAMDVDEGPQQPPVVPNAQSDIHLNIVANQRQNLQTLGNVSTNSALNRSNNNIFGVTDFALNHVENAARTIPVGTPTSPTGNNTNQQVILGQSSVQNPVPPPTNNAVDSNPFRAPGSIASAAESYHNYMAASKGLTEFNESTKSTRAWLIKFDSACKKLTEDQKHTTQGKRLGPRHLPIKFSRILDCSSEVRTIPIRFQEFLTVRLKFGRLYMIWGWG
jgi:hypothetical protein